MKYKELYTAESGIFAVLKSVNPSLYTTLFSDTESTVLDAYAYFVASERTFVPAFAESTATAVLTAVFYNFADTWAKSKAALTASYEVTAPNVTTETTKGTDTTDTVGSVTDTGSDKAFNSSDFVAKDKTERATDNNNVRTYDIQKTTTHGTDNVAESIREEITLRAMHTVLSVVTTEIINSITLSVYE